MTCISGNADRLPRLIRIDKHRVVINLSQAKVVDARHSKQCLTKITAICFREAASSGLARVSGTWSVSSSMERAARIAAAIAVAAGCIGRRNSHY